MCITLVQCQKSGKFLTGDSTTEQRHGLILQMNIVTPDILYEKWTSIFKIYNISDRTGANFFWVGGRSGMIGVSSGSYVRGVRHFLLAKPLYILILFIWGEVAVLLHELSQPLCHLIPAEMAFQSLFTVLPLDFKSFAVIGKPTVDAIGKVPGTPADSIFFFQPCGRIFYGRGDWLRKMLLNSHFPMFKAAAIAHGPEDFGIGYLACAEIFRRSRERRKAGWHFCLFHEEGLLFCIGKPQILYDFLGYISSPGAFGHRKSGG